MKTAFVVKVLIFAFFFCTFFGFQLNAFADTANTNQAGVIIDTGKEVKTACITFQGDSITGAQALELANSQPVFQSYAGVGRAVCSLCGVGCPAGDSCLTCAGSMFWNYFRAPADQPTFTVSGIGAGSSRVKPGDVEGWKFGVGQKPPYISFNTICGIKTENTTESSMAASKDQMPGQDNFNDSQTGVGKSKNVSTDKVVTQSSSNTKVLGKTIDRNAETKQRDGSEDKVGADHSSAKGFGIAVAIAGLVIAGFLVLWHRMTWPSNKKNGESDTSLD